MTMPPLQHLRVWHTLKAMPHPPQLLWRLSGAPLQCAHNKYLYTVADNAVPVNIVPCTFIQAPAFLACRIRLRLVPRRYPTKPLSLESFASSKFFCLSRRSSLSARVWSELENPPLPFNYQIISALACWELGYFLFADVTGFRIPNPNLLTGVVLISSTIVESDFSFQRQYEAKSSPEYSFPLPQSPPPIHGYSLYKHPL